MKITLIALLICVWASASQAYRFERRGTGICKAPYKALYTEKGWRCYAFHQAKKTFAAAKAQCIEEGGMLASVPSQKVFDFIVANIKTFKPVPKVHWTGLKILTKWSKGYWLGSMKSGGIYKWFDEEESPVHGHWLKNQPDNGLGFRTEECLSQMLTGWNDSVCTWKTRFICERGPSYYYPNAHGQH